LFELRVFSCYVLNKVLCLNLCEEVL